MTAYLSPASKVHLVNSSLGTLYPTVDEDAGDREVYFIFYCHATDVGPWELSLDLVVSVPSVPNPCFLMEWILLYKGIFCINTAKKNT